MKDHQNIRNFNDYIDGSAVRKIQEVPQTPQKTSHHIEEDDRRASRRRAAARNQQKALHMSPAYAGFLLLVTVVFAAVCIQYLQLQSSIMTKSQNIVTMEQKIDSLVAQNDAVEYNISSYVDTQNIIKVATKELGMVKAAEDQISFYEKSESEYMKQVGDIPED